MNNIGPQAVSDLRYRTAKLFYMVKGHVPEWLLDAPDDMLTEIHDQYLKRMWNNAEAYLHEEGWEAYWEDINK